MSGERMQNIEDILNEKSSSDDEAIFNMNREKLFEMDNSR